MLTVDDALSIDLIQMKVSLLSHDTRLRVFFDAGSRSTANCLVCLEVLGIIYVLDGTRRKIHMRARHLASESVAPRRLRRAAARLALKLAIAADPVARRSKAECLLRLLHLLLVFS